MRFTLVAVAVGAGIGLLAGGRVGHLGDHRLRSWPALVAGLGAQALSTRVEAEPGLVLLLASYALLVSFALANFALVGMGLVALGITLNMATIAVNDGMPVREQALLAAAVAERAALSSDLPGRKRHLERSDDRLMALADVIPVRRLREVLSFGDLVMAVGLADVVVHLLRPRPAHARPVPALAER